MRGGRDLASEHLVAPPLKIGAFSTVATHGEGSLVSLGGCLALIHPAQQNRLFSFTVLIVNSFYRSRFFGVFTLTASTMSAFSAASSTVSPSWNSMARTVLLSRRVLKSFFGSFI